MKPDGSNVREARRKLILGAFVAHEGKIYPVQVRDVASGGALLVSSAPLWPEQSITIRRRESVVHAIVVWREADRIGVRFTPPIDPHTWIPELGPPALRSEDTPVPPSQEGVFTEELSGPAIQRRISEEMDLVSRSLELISDEISNDRIGLSRFAEQIQRLTMLAGELHEPSTLIRSPDQQSDIWKVKIESLRRRLTR